MFASNWQKQRSNILSILSAFGAIFIVLTMLIWPGETYEGARYGLELWATVLVPSLLPFFIITEILLNIGVVSMLGILLEPVMRPLFNLPGSASFVVAMGFTSGFPMGAVLTRRLCEEKECTISEGERLVAFTNNSSPLFIMAAVAVGMFQNVYIGVILAISHYLANIFLGIMLGITSPREQQNYFFDKHLFINSIKALLQAQQKRKPWSKLLSEAIRSGINNICLIGGFVIIYAIVIKILNITALLNLLKYPFGILLQIFGFSPNLSSSLATGLWEMTLGLKETALSPASFGEKAVIASILLGWSGLSIQSQVTSVLAGSGISPRLYYRGRILQSFIAGLITYFLTLHQHWLSFLSLPVITPLPPNNTLLSLFTFNFLSTCTLFYYASIFLFLISCLALGLNYVSNLLSYLSNLLFLAFFKAKMQRKRCIWNKKSIWQKKK